MSDAQPSPFDLIQVELIDILFGMLTDRMPNAARAVAEEMRARARVPSEHAVDRNAVFATLLERMVDRLAARFPEPVPEPPPGTVSLAAARARRGSGTGPTGRPAA
jgi:hypothetical protein